MPDWDYSMLGERIIMVAGVVTALGLIWKFVWRGFLKPVRDAAVAVRDTVNGFPEQAERLETVVETQVVFQDMLVAAQDNQKAIQGRLEDGEIRFESIDWKLDKIVKQISNGDDTKTIPDRIEACDQTIKSHSRDDLANFRALGQWSEQFKDFTPFKPVAGFDDEH